MGMDVYGLKPKTKVGEYFRNNVWYWHPLWDFCCFYSPELTDKVQDGHSNSGDGLNAVDSRKLGFAIQESIANGAAQKYISEYYVYLETLSKDVCFCVKKTASSLTDLLKSLTDIQLVFQENSSLEQSYDSTGPIPFPKESSSPNPDCTNCNGSGEAESFLKNYNITLENIQNFANFLVDCGGFQIC